MSLKRNGELKSYSSVVSLPGLSGSSLLKNENNVGGVEGSSRSCRDIRQESIKPCKTVIAILRNTTTYMAEAGDERVN